MKKLVILLVSILSFNALFAKDTIPSKHYYLVFSARDFHLHPFSIGGHAFVSWTTKECNNDTMISQQTLGFYPNPNSDVVKSTLQFNQGRIMKGFNFNRKGMKLEQMTIEVDSATWVRSQQIEMRWDRHEYNLLRSNCVSFIDKVAGLAKLKRIKTTKWKFIPVRPVKYIRKMVKKNHRKVVSTDTVCIVE